MLARFCKGFLRQSYLRGRLLNFNVCENANVDHDSSEDHAPVSCAHCGMSMRYARAIATNGLPDLLAFQCDLCGVVVAGEAVAEAQKMGALSYDSPLRVKHRAF